MARDDLLFKVLRADGSCTNGGNGKWNLPIKNNDGSWTPGEWMPPIEGELVPCENGYHLCRLGDLIGWLGEAIFTAEYRGECVAHGDKLVVREARLLAKVEAWNERTARLFTCDCAERVLPIFECEYPDDARPRNAIAIARQYADGEATKEELAAARVVAWDTVRDTTWAVAKVAARTIARVVARDIARVVAWDARDVARAATSVSGRIAEREWQTENLMKYLRDDRAVGN